MPRKKGGLGSIPWVMECRAIGFHLDREWPRTVADLCCPRADACCTFGGLVFKCASPRLGATLPEGPLRRPGGR